MLRMPTLPGSLLRVLEPFRPCFTTPTFATFVTLLPGIIVQPAHRTVCGMLAGAGLAGVWHHSRAHRFFATTRWNPDTVGLTVLRLIIGHLVPAGAPLTVAVDDTLFRRSGRKVHAAHWTYDGSLKVAKGNQKLSRSNTFVVPRSWSRYRFWTGRSRCRCWSGCGTRADPRRPCSPARWSRRSPSPRAAGSCMSSPTVPTCAPNFAGSHPM